MNVKLAVLNGLAKMAEIAKRTLEAVGGDYGTKILAHLSGRIVPIVSERTQYGMIQFLCPGWLPVFRARTLLTKEPETIKWIDNFDEGDIFWDIGANVGVYSLYAAIRGSPVIAFEPSPGNYYLISKNIEINKMDDQVSVYCIALSDDTQLDSFYMVNTELGGALNSFGEAIDQYGEPYTAYFKQATIGFSIDEFMEQFSPLFPNHIKIDVDGIEGNIIQGAGITLGDNRLKSLLVELDTEREEYTGKIIDKLSRYGLELSYPKIEKYPERGVGKQARVCNHIFVRS